jgi:hypothetical protein
MVVLITKSIQGYVIALSPLSSTARSLYRGQLEAQLYFLPHNLCFLESMDRWCGNTLLHLNRIWWLRCTQGVFVAAINWVSDWWHGAVIVAQFFLALLSSNTERIHAISLLSVLYTHLIIKKHMKGSKFVSVTTLTKSWDPHDAFHTINLSYSYLSRLISFPTRFLSPLMRVKHDAPNRIKVASSHSPHQGLSIDI